jgi:DegV family protein with EDD domain
MLTIITDSTSDLGPEIANEFNLKVVPLLVTIGGNVYRDGMEISQNDLFKLVEKHGELPKTAAPSIGEFTRLFDVPGEVIFIGISSKLSATVQNAQLAAQSFPNGKVRIIDSLNLSTGVGLLALKAAELCKAGSTVEKVEEELVSSRSKISTSFVIDTMEFLYKGGRCTALQAVAGSVLKIHPVIEVHRDGTLGVKEKVRGTLQKGFQALLNDFEMHLNELDRGRVFVTHTCPDDADVQPLVDGVKRIAAPQEIRVTRAGSVVSSHCGPGTAGILYFVK